MGPSRSAARSTARSTARSAATALGLTLVLGAGVAGAWWWGSDDEESVAAGPVEELGWDDLVPTDWEPPADPFASMSSEELDELMDGSDASNRRLAEIDEAMSYAPTVDELDGRRVRIPGYVVPLDYDGQTRVDEFLLVPYFGACIHTPPPPANQVVHANASSAIELDSLYDPVWAVGTLATETVTSALAESGYRMRIERVEPYTETPGG